MNTYLIQNIYRYLIYGVALLTALPFHEFAHAWTANKLGDPTARYQGRLTLNPLKHLDPIGSILMIVCGIGWARPVPINPYNFQNPKVGMAISSLAGPVSNLLLAYISMIGYKLSSIASYYAPGVFTSNLMYIFATLISVNIGLAVFNIIPVPPLDGSRILNLVLPERMYFQVMRYERVIMVILMVVVYFGFLNRPLSICRSVAFDLLDFLTGWIDMLWRLIA